VLPRPNHIHTMAPKRPNRLSGAYASRNGPRTSDGTRRGGNRETALVLQGTDTYILMAGRAEIMRQRWLQGTRPRTTDGTRRGEIGGSACASRNETMYPLMAHEEAELWAALDL